MLKVILAAFYGQLEARPGAGLGFLAHTSSNRHGSDRIGLRCLPQPALNAVIAVLLRSSSLVILELSVASG